MRQWSQLGAAAIAAVTMSLAHAESVDLVLVAGDVNAGPVGDVTLLSPPLGEYVIAQPTVRFRSATNGIEDQAAWTYATPDGDAFGPEMSMAHMLVASQPNRSLGIMRFSMSDATLACDWQADPCGTGALQTMLGRVSTWRADLAASGVESTVAGVIWMHGESGADEDVAGYETNLELLITGVRTAFDDAGLPVVVTLPQSGTTWSREFSMAIDVVAAADVNVATVSLDTLEQSNTEGMLAASGIIAAGMATADALLGRDPFDMAVLATTCAKDLLPDGTVDVGDLLYLIGLWGPCSNCRFDFDGDEIVGVDDLLVVIGAWGTASGDVTGDGITGVDDMLAMISAWGPCGPNG
jgi:hypothetical protein